MEEVIESCYKKAIEAVTKCCTPNGLFASAGPNGYNAIWSRDSVITFLGASLIKNDLFKKTFRQSLITLANHQAEKGQIPNAVDKFSERKPHVDFQTIDSTLWFIIGEYIYKKRYKDSSLFNKHKKNIERGHLWITYQDIGNDFMPEQLPTADWQDAFPHRYGHTINTQALYNKVLILMNRKKESKKLNDAVNGNHDYALWNENYYYPWRWKNHNSYHERGEWFDSLGNLLAIIFDLADKNKTEKILAHIKKEKIDSPYPLKAIYPPIQQGTKDWQDYFLDCEAGIPYHYLNGGIWTYIGGFYVLALLKAKKFKEAEYQLEQLAKANLQTPIFSEWLNGQTGIPGVSASGSEEGNQAWNAGVYILAYESIKNKKVLI